MINNNLNKFTDCITDGIINKNNNKKCKWISSLDVIQPNDCELNKINNELLSPLEIETENEKKYKPIINCIITKIPKF